MDPNDPNNQNSLTDPTAGTMPQTSQPPPVDPAPDLSVDSLYGPSTPEDLATALPPQPNAADTAADQTEPVDVTADPNLGYDQNAAEDPAEGDGYVDPNASDDQDYAADYADTADDAAADASNEQYYQAQADEQLDPNAVQLDPAGATQASAASLPPIPTKSKMPLMLVAIGAVMLLGILVGVMVFVFRSPGRTTASPSPVPVEEDILCSEEPDNPDCIEEEPLESEEPLPSTEPTATPSQSATPQPSPTTNARPSLTPQRCQLLYGGPCP